MHVYFKEYRKGGIQFTSRKRSVVLDQLLPLQAGNNFSILEILHICFTFYSFVQFIVLKIKTESESESESDESVRINRIRSETRIFFEKPYFVFRKQEKNYIEFFVDGIEIKLENTIINTQYV